MSKVIIALGSFVAGISFVLVFGSPHTSIVVHPSTASAEEPPSSSTALNGIILKGLTPIVPDLSHIALRKIKFAGNTQQLDGLHCEGCLFDGVTLVYGGGQYNLPSSVTTGHTTYQFIGAAANTYQLLVRIGACTVQEPPNPPWLTNPNPKIPISVPANIKGKTIDLIGLGREK